MPKKAYFITALLMLPAAVCLAIFVFAGQISRWFWNIWMPIAVGALFGLIILMNFSRLYQKFAYRWKSFWFYFAIPYLLLCMAAAYGLVLYIAWVFSHGDF